MRFLAPLFAATLTVPASAQMTMPAPDAASKVLLKSSTPADGAMMQGGPPAFSVSFAQPTTLQSVVLTDDTGTAVPVTAAPVQTDASSATVALPALEPSTYRLTWTGLTNGAAVSGAISFMVH